MPVKWSQCLFSGGFHNWQEKTNFALCHQEVVGKQNKHVRLLCYSAGPDFTAQQSSLHPSANLRESDQWKTRPKRESEGVEWRSAKGGSDMSYGAT